MIRFTTAISKYGRFEEIRMSHWSYREMQECFGFSLDQYLFYGGYPAAATLVGDEDRFGQYIQSASSRRLSTKTF